MHGNKMHTDALHNQSDEHIEGEQTYLRVAEIVLADALQPLKAREIVDRGIERGLFGDHVLSRTPEKSITAVRLRAEDSRNYPFNAVCYCRFSLVAI
jgi:hypothetical protein